MIINKRTNFQPLLPKEFEKKLSARHGAARQKNFSGATRISAAAGFSRNSIAKTGAESIASYTRERILWRRLLLM
jgi:hypothetical protein